MTRNGLAAPIAAIVLLSLGGFLMHMRSHPVSFDPADPSNPAFLVPFAAGVVSVVAAPVLLAFRRTFITGYLLNGMSVVVGTITMAALGLSAPPAPLSASGVALNTTLPLILILLPKLMLGQSVLRSYHPNGMGRLFTPWWWMRHFVYLGAVFSLGRIIWR